MGNLKKMLNLQSELDKAIAQKKNLRHYNLSMTIREKCNALLGELVELLNECNGIRFWNWKLVKEEKIKEEFIDVLHFVLSIANDLFVNDEDLFAEYESKNAKNLKRLLKGGKWNE